MYLTRQAAREKWYNTPMNLEGYNGWLGEISKRYRQSQIKAAVAVNTEMLKFYFGLRLDFGHLALDGWQQVV